MKFDLKQRILLGLIGALCFTVIALVTYVIAIVFTSPLIIGVHPYITVSALLFSIVAFIIGGNFLCRLGLGLLITSVLGHDDWDLN